MSDSELAELIDELDNAINSLMEGKYIPGFMAILIETKMVLKNFQNLQIQPNQNVEKPTPFQSEKCKVEIIPIHLVIAGSDVSACCGKNMFDLPLSHKCTLDKELVTCQGEL